MTIELESWDQGIVVEQVPNPGDILLTANDYYRRPPEVSVPVVQLSYANDQGRFPWEVDCDSDQPLRGSLNVT